MLTSKKVKQYAKMCGADLVGIGSMDRFEGAPKEMDPRYIFPEAKSIIGLGFRINRGCFRGIEEGTYYEAYPFLGYASINLVHAPIVMRAICNMLEEEGYEGVPLGDMLCRSSITPETGAKREISRPVSPDRPAPDVFVHFRISAVICGMGERGFSGLFLSPEFGPRQRLAFVLTDAPLEPDPIFEGKICDRCMRCVRDCTVNALDPKNTVKVVVAGKELEWAKLDPIACSSGYCGANPQYSPHTPPDYNWQESIKKGFYQATRDIAYNQASVSALHHGGALEGARGCMRACFIHLEETGRIKKVFKNKFRVRKPWRLE